jgi:hypothetical protein
MFSSTPRHSPAWHFMGAALVLLLWTALAAFGIGEDSIWFDEGWSAFAAAQPTVIAAANADATNPPLYYALLHIHVRLLGDSEFSLRLFSLFCGLIALALAYRLAVRLADRRAGLFTLVLALPAPLLLWGAREARMYTLLAVIVLIAALAWHRLLNRSDRRAWVALALAELAALYAHNSGPVIVVWLNGVTLLVWSIGRSGRPSFRIWMIVQMLVIALYLPYFVTRFLLLGEANAAIASAPEWTPAFLFDVWRSLWVTPWERVVRTEDGMALAAFTLMIAVGLWVIVRRGLWPLGHAAILTFGVIAALTVLGNELHSRYLVMIVPLLLGSLGIAISQMHSRPMRMAALIGLIGVSVWNGVTLMDSPFRHDDARGMVQHYAATLGAGDSVIAWSYADRYELAYYWERLGVIARRITLPEGAGYAAVQPLLPEAGSVALNIWFTQRADYRGMLGCLLADGTTARPMEFTTYGMTSRTYSDPALGAIALETRDVVFSARDGTPVLRLIAAAAARVWPADRAQCLPVRAELLTPARSDLRAAVIVRDDRARIIAQVDAVLATDNQRTTDMIAPGEIVEAYPLVRLPYGTTPGHYRFFLRIYDRDDHLSGYLPPTDMRTLGRDVELGDWIVIPGASWSDPSAAAEIPVRLDAVINRRRLIGYALPPDGAGMRNGDTVPLVLYWDGAGPLPDIRISSEGGGFRLPPEIDDPPDGIVRDMRLLRIPADAAAGLLMLSVENGPILRTWSIEPLAFSGDPPADLLRLQPPAHFPGLGTLVGIAPGPPDQVTLVWRAEAAAETEYTVFVHALAEDGRIIAQSDSQPAEGSRPTTGWRAGEYIVDVHRWALAEGVTLEQVAAARWIAGLYDASTGERVQLDQGGDAVTIR